MIQGPVRQRRIRRSVVHRWIAGCAAALGIVAASVAGYYAYGKRAAEAAEEAARTANQTAKAAARSIAEGFQGHLTTLQRLNQDTGLRTLFRAGDQHTLDANSETFKERFPGALKLRLLLPGTAEIRDAENPPLSYASLELLRTAETTSDPIGVEAQLWGTPKQHLEVVERVRDESGQLVGLIHLSTETRLLTSVIDGLKVTEGYLEIQQAERQGEALVLGKQGQRGEQAGPAPVKVSIPGTRWTVAAWPQTPSALALVAEMLVARPWGAAPLGLLAVGLVGIALFFLLAKRFLERRLSADGGVVDADAPALYHPRPQLSHKTRQGLPEASIPRERMLSSKPLADPTPMEQTPMRETQQSPSNTASPLVPDSVFRAYDIRGVVGETLTEEGVYAIGRAIGSEAAERGQQVIAIGRDGRASSPVLAQALERGLRESGRDVIDVGLVPTPVLYFATYHLGTHNGVVITGSHNPGNYNGLKIVLDGQALSGEAITAIRDRIKRNDFTSGAGSGRTVEIGNDYIRRITEDIPVALQKPLKVVVDCGNGVPGILAPKLIRALGHEVIELFCEVDGNFPNHHPDPSQPENLHDLINTVRRERADLGLAFDGDGDRLGVVDGQGNIIWPDRQMMLFARDVLSRNPGGEIIFDVKCSRHLRSVIQASGGVPLMWKTGHSLIKSKMREIDAPLAGEMSGHIFFKERWYGFDDALYAAARLLEILVKDPRPSAEVFAELPGGVATPELRLDMPETEHAPFMARLIDSAAFDGAEVHTVDGLRVDFADGWGLIRASNTTPCLILRFEADDQKALERIQSQFRSLIKGVGPELKLPF